MIKALYLISNPASFDAMLYLDAFIGQLPNQGIENHLLCHEILLAHANPRQRNLSVYSLGPDFDQEAWETLYEEVQPHVVILCDADLMLDKRFDDEGCFELPYLDCVECPVTVMDYKANLLLTSEGELAPKEYILNQKKPPRTLDYDFLMKVCPPHNGIPTQNPRVLQWRNSDLMGSFGLLSQQSETRQQLGLKEEDKVIVGLVPVETLIVAQERQIMTWFSLMSDAMIDSLNQLPGEYHLFLLYQAPHNTETRLDNVHVHYFNALEMDLLEGIVQIADLVFTPSLTHPALSRSSLRGTPALAIGSSLRLEKGELAYDFEALSPLMQLRLSQLKEEQPDLLKPFVSFPAQQQHPWPELDLFSAKNLFYLVDIFDYNANTKLIHELLNGGPERERFEETLNTFKGEKLSHTEDAEALIRKIITSPPRHLRD